MYFLLDACQHPTILRILYFVYLILDIVFIAVPIGLIIMLMVDFSKAVITGDEKEQIKSTKLVTNRIIYAVIIFVIPWIVNVLMIFMDTVELDIGGDYRVCITNVNAIRNETQTFEFYDALLEAEEEVERLEEKGNGGNNNAPDNSGNGSGGSGSSGNVSGGSVYELAASSLIDLVKGEFGKTDGTKYGGGSGESWCAYFTTWALKNTKLSDGTSLYNYINKEGKIISDGAASGIWPAFTGSSHLKFYKSSAYGGNYRPKKGDIVWFHWNGGYCQRNYGKWNGTTRCADHVGIVESFDGTYVHTIEGNTSGKVLQRQRNINDIVAFGSWYE